MDVGAELERLESQLAAKRKEWSPDIVQMFEMMLGLFRVLALALSPKLSSKTSSIPPSQDPNRPRGGRKRGARKVGGQNGHKGHTLSQVDSPDEISEDTPEKCAECGGDLSDTKINGTEKRQVFDLEINIKVKEYQAHKKSCECGCMNKGSFPESVKAPTQYGAGVKAYACYLSQYQLLPYARIQELLRDQLGLSVTASSVKNWNQELYERLESWECSVKEDLLKESLLYADETGAQCNKERHWFHVISNERFTYYHHSEKRGREAHREMSLFENYQGMLMHDCYGSYFDKDCTHLLCNAHLMRELADLAENHEVKWAQKLRSHIGTMHQRVQRGPLEGPEQLKLEKSYHEILSQGDQECPEPQRNAGQRGRLKKSKARNLLERLQLHSSSYLLWLNDSSIPFSNNLAERDLRMIKVQQKVSGSFRSDAGPKVFARIRSFLSSAKKQERSPLFDIQQAFSGT